MPSGQGYEMANRSEWSRVPVNEEQAIDPSDITVSTLHKTWYPRISKKLKTISEDGFDGEQDTVDSMLHTTTSPLFRSQLSDHIDGRGTFDAKELEQTLREMPRAELEDELGISVYKVRDIIRRSDVNKTGEIKYEDFLRTVCQYRISSEQASTLKSIVKGLAYAEEFTCYPPTVFMILVTLVETAFFVYHVIHLPSAHNLNVTWEGPVPYCSVLIYNPKRRWEIWRFVTYMCVHIGIGHFIFNMIMQIVVGVFLEMQQEGWIGSLRVFTVYMAGVVAGSLGTSLSDPYTFIAGASGGVYALIAAHLATLALNWQEDSAVKIRKVIFKPLTRIVRLVFIITLVAHDVGLAIYVRYFSDEENTTGFMGHFCGALAGLLVGIFILENRRVRTWETFVQWISISLFALLLGFAILWNVYGDSWYREWYGKGRFFPKPDYELYNDKSGNCKHYEYA